MNIGETVAIYDDYATQPHEPLPSDYYPSSRPQPPHPRSYVTIFAYGSPIEGIVLDGVIVDQNGRVTHGLMANGNRRKTSTYLPESKEFSLPHIGEITGVPITNFDSQFNTLHPPTLAEFIAKEDRKRADPPTVQGAAKIYMVTDAMLRELKKLELARRRGARDDEIEEIRTDIPPREDLTGRS